MGLEALRGVLLPKNDSVCRAFAVCAHYSDELSKITLGSWTGNELRREKMVCSLNLSVNTCNVLVVDVSETCKTANDGLYDSTRESELGGTKSYTHEAAQSIGLHDVGKAHRSKDNRTLRPDGSTTVLIQPLWDLIILENSAEEQSQQYALLCQARACMVIGVYGGGQR